MRLGLFPMLAITATLTAMAAQADPPKAAPASAPAGHKINLVYVPASPDGPKTRVTALVRGANAAVPLVCIIAPDHPATTLSEQPQLYWYLSEATDMPVGISLIRESDGEAVYERTLTKKTGGGFHCLDLAKENVKLAPDQQYQFVVAVIPNLKDRASDVVTSGIVVRVKTPDAVAKSAATGVERAAVLLKAGIWFDGLAVLMQQIEALKDEDKVSLVAARDALLEQIGLPQVVTKVAKEGVSAGKTVENGRP